MANKSSDIVLDVNMLSVFSFPVPLSRILDVANVIVQVTVIGGDGLLVSLDHH